MNIRRKKFNVYRYYGFTLVEVITAMVITAVVCAGIFYGYIMVMNQAEWSAYSLAAQSLAMQRLEQARSSQWSMLASPPVDELVQSNFPPQIEILDIPVKGTNYVYATNVTTIVDISTNPPLKLITVVCTWNFKGKGVYSNTIATYRTP